uniref:Thioredoxin family protein n=1 Tax=Acrobeloides nanus TaxID=290746 RepID=A0A914DNA6_9BILA
MSYITLGFLIFLSLNSYSQAQGSVKNPANRAEFDKTLSDAGDKLVVVHFTADLCAICRAFKYDYRGGPAVHPEIDPVQHIVQHIVQGP